MQIRVASRVLYNFRKYLPYIQPHYAVSRITTPQTINYFNTENVGIICRSSDHIHKVADVSTLNIKRSNNIICHIPSINKLNIMISNNANVTEFIVDNIADLKRISDYSPSAAFWLKAKISHDGISTIKPMFDYMWAYKRLYCGLVYNINNFYTGDIPPSMYSHKIAVDYLLRNVISYSDELGIQTPALHIDGRTDFTNISQFSDIHDVLTKSRLVQHLETRNIKVHATLGTIFDHTKI